MFSISYCRPSIEAVIKSDCSFFCGLPRADTQCFMQEELLEDQGV